MRKTAQGCPVETNPTGPKQQHFYSEVTMSKLPTKSLVLLVAGVLTTSTACQQLGRLDSHLTVEQIAARLGEMNERRKAALMSYQSRRTMTVTYEGPLSQGEAAEAVSMVFSAPASKQFTILSTSGAQLIRESVFQRALTAEQDAAGDAAQQTSALNLKNYTMSLAGREQLPVSDCFVLDVAPKVASEFTYSGRVWVHATDFAVVRIQGKPAVNPSPWISEGEFTTDFLKIGEFYFPQRTVSTSNLPLGLHARLSVQYGLYRILSAAPVHPAARLSGNEGQLP